MRGQHFGFLCILCTAWISARVAVLSYESLQHPFRAKASVSQAVPKMQRPASDRPVVADQKPVSSCCQTSMSLESTPHLSASYQRMTAVMPKATLSASVGPIAALQPVMASSLSPGPWPQPPPATEPQSPRRLQVYAYHFWRSGGGSIPLGTGRYGGGQSGVIATYRVAPDVSLLARVAVAHDDVREREVAAGVRWAPLQTQELMLTAEHRLRNAGSHSVAVYVAGGKSTVPLPLDFKLDTYGQLGFVSGRGGGAFFDAQARVEHEVITIEPIKLRAGGGVWAGGQKAVARLDVGPTISGNIDLGETSIRLDADWRFRIAGDARPANGPAITLSTSF